MLSAVGETLLNACLTLRTSAVAWYSLVFKMELSFLAMASHTVLFLFLCETGKALDKGSEHPTGPEEL